jgi:group I intron endonuclease
MGYIYRITNKITKQNYIGQTIQDLYERWKQHKKKNSNCVYLKAAFSKYGIENFDFKLICIGFDNDLNKLEIFYINKYNSVSPNGYNLRLGGNNGGKHSEETKRKISESLKKTLNSNNNKKVGKPHTEETKIKLSNISKGRKHKIETIEKLRLINTKHKVVQLDMSGNVINVFFNTVEAAKALNTTKNNICRACNGKIKSSKGFLFRYENN